MYHNIHDNILYDKNCWIDYILSLIVSTISLNMMPHDARAIGSAKLEMNRTPVFAEHRYTQLGVYIVGRNCRVPACHQHNRVPRVDVLTRCF